MNAVTGKQISFTYPYSGNRTRALSDISFTIEKGEFIAVLGENGCGKSTLAKHINALLPLQKGELTVFHINAGDETKLWELRRLCGMVFQNPDNQFVSSIVEEDVAFGLQNYNVPEEEIPEKVDHALSLVGMQDFKRRSPHTLSGGQKQRAAMAGVLAVDPDILLFDEATSMLDPKGRNEVLSCLKKLHSMGKTILMITHYAEEAVFADRIFLMQGGTILKTGTPRQILTDLPLLKKARLTPPVPVKLYYDLQKEGIFLSRCPLTNEELVEELCRLL